MNILFNYFENVNNIFNGDNTLGQLWLGNYKAAFDPVFLKKNNISVIVNCSTDIPYIYDKNIDMLDLNISKLEFYRLPVEDSLLEHDMYVMQHYFNLILPILLTKILTEKKNILIHCFAGKQRSACLVAALLYILVKNDLFRLNNDNDKNDLELMKTIIKYIIKKRPQAFTYGLRVNFKRSLERFFNILF